MKKLKIDTDVLLTVGLIGGLGAGAYFWWQSMTATHAAVVDTFKIRDPGTYSPRGPVADYNTSGGVKQTGSLTPNTNPASGVLPPRLRGV